jgi:hypothetical protein
MITGLLFMVIGPLIMAGSLLNWRIVSHPGKLLNLLLGDTLARIIYFVVGIALFILGIGRLIGTNWFGL